MKTSLGKKSVITVVIFLVSGWNMLHAQTDIKTYNSSIYLGNNKWSWKVYLGASKATLGKIKTVTYTLHRSFSPNVIKVPKIGDNNFPFAFSATGWGEFTIRVDIAFNNGTTKILYHPLKFQTPTAQNAIKTGNNCRQISQGWWSWTVFITTSNEVLNQIKCVEYTLHESFPNPVQLVYDKGTSAIAFPYSAKGWGTFRVKIKVIYLNGSTQDLYHDLQFKNSY
jgi:transcription initiation factor IIF auxiliary subunit